jgi:hypothetical protein
MKKVIFILLALTILSACFCPDNSNAEGFITFVNKPNNYTILALEKTGDTLSISSSHNEVYFFSLKDFYIYLLDLNGAVVRTDSVTDIFIVQGGKCNYNEFIEHFYLNGELIRNSIATIEY